MSFDHLNLFQAKTPAHSEFRSKYYRGPAALLLETSVTVPNSPNFDVVNDEGDAPGGDDPDFDEVGQPVKDEGQIRRRADVVLRRSLAR